MDSKIAIIELGGKQHLVKEGAVVVVNRLTDEEGAKLERPNILNTEKVSLKIVSHGLGKKINGLKFKPKARYMKRYGHRQHQTTVEVISIGQVKAEEKAEEAKAKPASKKVAEPKAKKAVVKKVKDSQN